jgi:predicted  nucleic acid-binding Zn-ribbon protein
MSQLDILKEQMESMENKIKLLKDDIEKSSKIVYKLEQEQLRIEFELNNAKNTHETAIQNYNYMSEVHKETMNNYIQIENAATPLLDIIKSKFDNVA